LQSIEKQFNLHDYQPVITNGISMNRFIVYQPNGLFSVFSNIIANFSYLNMNEHNIKNIFPKLNINKNLGLDWISCLHIIKQLHGNDDIKYILSNIGNEQTSNISYSDIT